MNTPALPKNLEYKEGIDFSVEEKITQTSPVNTSYEFFFRSPDGALLGYMSFNIIEEELGMKKEVRHAGYIIDTVAASAFDKIDERGQEFFREHGYKEDTSLKGFGTTMMTYVLRYMKRTHDDINIVLVNALEKNEKIMWNLINKVQDSTSDIIEWVSGGNDMHMATLFLKK